MAISRQYIDGQYLEKNPAFHVQDSPWKAEQIMRMLALQGLSPKTIAEIGCGAGEILVQLSSHLPNTALTGYELSPQGFQLCSSRAGARVKYFNTDPLADERQEEFDLILCIDVFEHVENYFEFLRSLRERGRSFIFHIPLDMNVQMVFRSSPIMQMRTTVGHLHYFSKDTALATLRDCGYAVQSWFYTSGGTERVNGLRSRLLYLPRKLFFACHKDLAARMLGRFSLLVYALPC